MPRHKNSLESQIIDLCIVEFDIEKPYLCLVCINPVCKKCIKQDGKKSLKPNHDQYLKGFEREMTYLQEDILKQ